MLKFYIFLLIILICFFQIEILKAESLCIYEDTCHSCLSADLSCAWCTDKQYELRYRCLNRSQLLQYGCDPDYIYGNELKFHTINDDPLQDYELLNHAVQVQPQKVFLKLVKSNPQRIKLSYRLARNNPLDLYVLMDLTWTMRDDKETLVKLGSELVTTLTNLTSNYRLGFGSFADKPEMPMIMPHLKDNPCATERQICEPTYGFKHHLTLTENENSFVKSVNGIRVTANLDNLEGGFDALMQVLVCTKQIGWKEEARKVVIMVTDGFMHFAGDGLLAGITKRNDKQCHLSPEGDYLGSLEYDYPSLEEIYRELIKRKISVIFAVTEEVVATYREISNLMKEISNVEILRTDSSNILELIKKSYESFIRRAQFSDNSPEFIKMEYETDCGGQFPTLRKRNYCSDVKPGTTVDFYITITLTDFPKDGVYLHRILVEESALNEFLEIEVEIQKPCPCEEEAEPVNEYGRFQCNDNGFLQCGMCHCDAGWTGTFCTCHIDSMNATTNEAIENLCRQPTQLEKSSELNPVCSNRGECDCGTCFCFPGFNGKFCECDECDIDCDPERADCVCGECVCKYGWSGNRCNCKESTDGCIGPTGEICLARGYCECGECLCDEPYKGKFCEIGSDADNKLCTFYEPCVICLIEERTDVGKCENTSDICSSAERNERFTTTFVTEEIDADVRCLARVENKLGIKCDHYFTYQTMGQLENYLLIQLNNCEPTNFMAIIGFVSIGTFILGLLIILLIWTCIRIKDAREYARFEEEQHNSYLMESPIYKDPVSRYIVPKEITHNQSNPFL